MSFDRVLRFRVHHSGMDLCERTACALAMALYCSNVLLEYNAHTFVALRRWITSQSNGLNDVDILSCGELIVQHCMSRDGQGSPCLDARLCGR